MKIITLYQNSYIAMVQPIIIINRIIMNQTEATILIMLDQIFKKQLKDKKQQWQFVRLDILFSNNNVQKAMLKEGNMYTGKSSQKCMAIVERTLSNHPFYTIVTKINESNQKIYCVKREMKFQKIRDYQSLKQQISKNVAGLIVDTQLLQHSYANVELDIKKGLKGKEFIRINHQGYPKDKRYFLFGKNNLSVDYGSESKQQIFNIDDYLNLCKQCNNNKIDDNLFGGQQQKKMSHFDNQINNYDPNYRLPGFTQMKKQWKMKQYLKSNIDASLAQKDRIKAEMLELESIYKRKKENQARNMYAPLQTNQPQKDTIRKSSKKINVSKK